MQAARGQGCRGPAAPCWCLGHSILLLSWPLGLGLAAQVGSSPSSHRRPDLASLPARQTQLWQGLGGGGTLGPDSPSLSWHLPHQGALACPGAAEFEECLGSRGREEIWAGGDQNQQVVWVSGAHQDPGPSQSSEPCPLYLFIRLDGAGRLGYGKGLLMEGTVRKKAPPPPPHPPDLAEAQARGPARAGRRVANARAMLCISTSQVRRTRARMGTCWCSAGET